MSFRRDNWKVSRFCGDIFVVYDCKGHEVCKTYGKDVADYLCEISKHSEDVEKIIEKKEYQYASSNS